ncbi:sulfate ABC transporter permease subunit CysT [Rhodobacter sphaeroides]|jgi:sulfate transport system permease protein|uniref:Sulfate transport system permease protein CysT n=2 Tax=Cereibacter sphaeroides TaxID=1063 RepID=Q3IVX6_CERS4|nr:sulfate ABC transporter permease subunit CysT [Cereibacter sphaeroides]ABA81308.1 ABC sulfate/thiosulfate transporter, inner membrane subunit CysT [Cereibacter sphaeroides 2.4.1]AMJ49602.1 sulfate/thiosulfate transporter subunit [Cereibacter sphaeroides]ANS36316.1 sulfate/thiosulfate transporter subunit [Cereibacter sphaeroides]ATN65373.1 sulfate/thiosulfate transporter subunit [Cereibacter sphaeroides]AXC63600.1 sulfate ABC transporter permease subunit CysT [Cereibacter sphaeroides 2.4.1]
MIARTAPGPARRSKRVLPGFGLTMGMVLTYLGVIVLLPVVALVLKGADIGPARFWAIVTAPRTLAALRLTLLAAGIATLVNTLYGLLMAWVLVRYEFPGKRFLDAMVDIPFALPTAVAGLSLSALFAASGWYGAILEPMGIQVVYTIWGVAAAMSFTSIPFVIRTVQPVLEDLDPQFEQAAVTLGAHPFTIFRRVILPAIAPALLVGVTLSFARSLGEFGAVVFIAGNLPMKTEIASLLAVIRLEEYDYNGAAVIALTLLAIALVLLGASNLLQARALRYKGKQA